MVETVIIIGLLLVALFYTGTVDTKKFFNEEDGWALKLMEKDYAFYLYAKYGENVNVNKLFMTRIKNAFYSTLALAGIMAAGGNFSALNLGMLLLAGFFIFKSFSIFINK